MPGERLPGEPLPGGALTDGPVRDGSVEVMGQQVALPVEVRAARSAMATFVVRRDPVRRLLDGSGVEPLSLPLGRTLCILAMVDYRDNDLGAYGEVAVAFPVARRDGDPPGAYIHQLPVDGEFTCAAGREIWGFPKWMASIALEVGSRRARCRLAEGDELVLDLEVRPRPVPLPDRPTSMVALANLDGTLRRTPFDTRPTAVRGGPGGARLHLGDRHPVALQLRSIGLPRRAVFSSVVGNLAGSFGPAVEVPAAQATGAVPTRSGAQPPR